MPTTLTIRPLTVSAFAPYGQVLATWGPGRSACNGRARRFGGLTELSHRGNALQPVLDLYRVTPSVLPLSIDTLERHPLSSQAFIPMEVSTYLVVVALPSDHGKPDPSTLRAFRADASQGINYRPGVWHHPITALDGGGDFAMFMWQAPPGEDQQLATLPVPVVVALDDPPAS